ncbi:ISAon1 family transposase [Adhaeribacter soli]|uniref:Transposase n=1 Tax=Adhaeribacter soli TaxID=2607655 RepID=A0A5N1IS25_9BACT|nr:transposase [Adhaeribacter soli]KAA9331136.1 transposase [Adhaeribacter soli]
MGQFFHVDGKQLQQQYKDHISSFHEWEQKAHAKEWMLFAENISPSLSIDETALSNGELYTILTSKTAKGGKGSLVAMIKGTRAEDIIAVLSKLPEKLRHSVKEVTLDMAANMQLAVKRCFPKADRVTDRFHVQKLAYDALQEVRIKYRWQALDQESSLMAEAKAKKEAYQPETLSNGDTLKQLLARSRYLLFRHPGKWTVSQKERADILFELYPQLQKAYALTMRLGKIFAVCKTKEQAFKQLALWYNEVEEAEIDSFKTVCRSVQAHYLSILNFFNNRSTNAAAESFNAKVKAFRATSRGVRDTAFFLFRLANIYA